MGYADRSLPDLLLGAADFVKHITDRVGDPVRCSICEHAAELIVALEHAARVTRPPTDARALLHRETARDLAAMASAGGYPPAKCAGCGEFISAIRVEMGLSRCSDCDGKPRRKGRR